MQIYADMDRIDRIESDMANGLKPGYEQVSEWMETLGDERLYELTPDRHVLDHERPQRPL